MEEVVTRIERDLDRCRGTSIKARKAAKVRDNYWCSCSSTQLLQAVKTMQDQLKASINFPDGQRRAELHACLLEHRALLNQLAAGITLETSAASRAIRDPDSDDESIAELESMEEEMHFEAEDMGIIIDDSDDSDFHPNKRQRRN